MLIPIYKSYNLYLNLNSTNCTGTVSTSTNIFPYIGDQHLIIPWLKQVAYVDVKGVLFIDCSEYVTNDFSSL